MQYLEQVKSWLYVQFHGIESWLVVLSGVSIVALFFAIVALVMRLRLRRERRSFNLLEAKRNAEIIGIKKERDKELSRVREDHASVVSDLEQKHTKDLEEREVMHERKVDEMRKKNDSTQEALEEKAKTAEEEAKAAEAKAKTAEEEAKAAEEKAKIAEEKAKDAEAKAREARAGWVYIASNVGSFGPDVYKIGMTQREDPDMRLAELSDASVPFPFELHARAQGEDALGLKSELHRYFADRSFNMANTRREFFRVPFSQIKEKLLELAPNAEIIREEPEAPEYRRSQYLMREKR